MRRDVAIAAARARGKPARGRPRPWVAAAAVAALLAAAPASPADLNGTAEVAWVEEQSEAASNQYLRQTFLLDWRRRFSLPISYRLSMRYQDDEGDQVSTRTLTPTASLDYRIEELGVQASWRLNDEDSAGTDRDRTVTRTFVSLLVRPFEHGDGSVAADRLAYRSAGLETTDDRFGVTFRYTSPELRITNENRLQQYQDATADSSRISMGPRITIAWGRPLGERLQVATHYVLDYLRTEQTTRSAAPQSVPVDLEPIAGLVGEDSTPDLTPPLAPEPRLVDRAFDATAGIAVGGPLGRHFQNVAVDLGRYAEADELRVHVRTPAGALVPVGDPVRWDVYTSQDGLRWAPVAGVSQAFNAAMSAWVLTFDAPAARYFKAVNFGLNDPHETEVTELQAFVHEAFQPNETHTGSSVRQALGLSVGFRPMAGVQLALTSQTNVTAVTAWDGETNWSEDTSNAVTATLGPWGPMRYVITGAQSWAGRATGEEVRSWAATATARYQPIERYTAEAVLRAAVDSLLPAASRSWERATTWGATLRNEGTLFPTLRASVGGGAMRQTIADGSTSDFLTGAGQVLATLAAGVELQLDAALQRRWSLSGDTRLQQEVPLFQVVTYEVYAGEVRCRPSSQLSLAARLGYTSGASAAGWSQTYRANWSPFPGGAIQLAFDYSEEVDPLSGQTFRRVFASPRWILNRHATLQLSYNMVRGTGTLPIEQQNLYATFTVKL